MLWFLVIETQNETCCQKCMHPSYRICDKLRAEECSGVLTKLLMREFILTFFSRCDHVIRAVTSNIARECESPLY